MEYDRGGKVFSWVYDIQGLEDCLLVSNCRKAEEALYLSKSKGNLVVLRREPLGNGKKKERRLRTQQRVYICLQVN